MKQSYIEEMDEVMNLMRKTNVHNSDDNGIPA